MKLKVEQVPVGELTPDPDNVRSHDQRNLQSIRASLDRWGQQKPIVVDGAGVVVAGNGTLAAAMALGWDTVSVVRTKLTGVEARAFAVADNRTAELASWDDGLGAMLAGLDGDVEFDGIEALGFTEEEFAELTGTVETLDPASAFSSLPSTDRDKTIAMTFTVRDEDVRDVGRALAIAKRGAADDGNKNGLALAAICRSYIGTCEEDQS